MLTNFLVGCVGMAVVFCMGGRMSKAIVGYDNRDWYDVLVDECKAIITEAVFTSRWAMVEGYHQLGERIVTDEKYKKAAKGNLSSLSDLSKNIGIGERTVYRAMQFYEKYPNLDMLPDGKNISWNKIITQYLPAQKKPDTPPLPEGKYSVIYMDPPWPVGSIVMDKWESPIDDKYPTMTLEEIGRLPISDLSADECSLFLWTTHTFLGDALELIKLWDYKYFCCIAWDKGNGWTQNGFHKRTELLLYAYKGGINIDATGIAIPTIITERKTYHSKKPDSIRELIENKTPAPRLEMFARNEYKGWTAWGNEVRNE